MQLVGKKSSLEVETEVLSHAIKNSFVFLYLIVFKDNVCVDEVSNLIIFMLCFSNLRFFKCVDKVLCLQIKPCHHWSAIIDFENAVFLDAFVI